MTNAKKKFGPREEEPLAILSAGGTFEKVYDHVSGQLGFGRSRLKLWHSQCRMPDTVRLEPVMLVDSAYMSLEQRAALCERIAAAEERLVVVIHGTDSLVESASLADDYRRDDQVVVFTGAMVPISHELSDALFNLGMAVATARTCEPGVWVALSGQIFPYDLVDKDRKKGRFIWTPSN